MIVKLNKNYFNIYINRIMLLLLNIQFISYEFADSICEEIRKDIDLYSSCSFLCIENDILSGMLIARSIGEYVPNKNTCEIKYLSVNPDFKRKGIATSLVENLKTRCGSYFDCIYLTVYENNSKKKNIKEVVMSFDHAAFQVSDMDSSIDFYTQKLGF